MSNLWNSRTNSIIDGVEYKNISLKIQGVAKRLVNFESLELTYF